MEQRPRPNIKPVPVELVEDLIRSSAAIEEARERRDGLIVKALKAGASYQAIADATQMSKEAIRLIARKRGWPDKAELAKRAKAKAEKDAWLNQVHEIQRQLGIRPPS